eukprot:5179651-Prorocentrum_lima.AAC.1
MTSSLVGSEMCIRDSSYPPCVPASSTSRSVPEWISSDANEDLNAIREKAVSYTHLTLPTICSV